MNKEEYQKTKTQLEKQDKPTPLTETNKEGIPKFAQREQQVTINKNKAFTPIKGQTENNKEKSRQLLNRYKDKIPMHNNQKEDKYTGKNLQELNINTEELPDISEFLQSEEYLRNGIRTRIPIPITLNGQEYKVYIRSLSSNEYYKLQLRQVREKKSLNYLAATTVCEDGNGNKIPQEFFDELGFEITERIGEAISVASGSDGQDDRVANVVEKYLTG